jgi:hypothetical protein
LFGKTLAHLVDCLKQMILLVPGCKAAILPPKQAQALLQGGTFVFNGDRTVYAHYDPSTAAHADVDEVLAIARAEMTLTQ